MGLSFRKSFKIGKNTRINVSKKGGLGVSTGVKGARISANKQGVRKQVGANGLYYRTQHSWKSGSNNEVHSSDGEIVEDKIGYTYIKIWKVILFIVILVICANISGLLMIIPLMWLIFYCSKQAIRGFKERKEYFKNHNEDL